jgi:hypothetical protein
MAGPSGPAVFATLCTLGFVVALLATTSMYRYVRRDPLGAFRDEQTHARQQFTLGNVGGGMGG